MDRERNVTTTAHPFGAKSDFGVRTKKKEGVTQPTNIVECFKPPAGPVYESETPCPHYLSSPPHLRHLVRIIYQVHLRLLIKTS